MMDKNAMPVIDVNHAQIHYQLDGPEHAPLLVLSNSLGTDVGMWQPQLGEFSRQFRVLRYDSRGHGASSVTPGPYSIAQLAQDLLSLLDELGMDRVHFCGLSIGGAIGMWLAIHAPERLNKLVLCNTAARIGTPEMWNARIQAVRDAGMAAIADAILQRWFTSDFYSQGHAQIEAVHRTLLAIDPQGYVASCMAVRDMDLRSAVADICVPTLVISGAHDTATPPQDGNSIAAQIPGAQYIELDAGHLSNIEAAEPFTRAISRFLNESGEA